MCVLTVLNSVLRSVGRPRNLTAGEGLPLGRSCASSSTAVSTSVETDGRASQRRASRGTGKKGPRANVRHRAVRQLPRVVLPIGAVPHGGGALRVPAPAAARRRGDDVSVVERLALRAAHPSGQRDATRRSNAHQPAWDLRRRRRLLADGERHHLVGDAPGGPSALRTPLTSHRPPPLRRRHHRRVDGRRHGDHERGPPPHRARHLDRAVERVDEAADDM